MASSPSPSLSLLFDDHPHFPYQPQFLILNIILPTTVFCQFFSTAKSVRVCKCGFPFCHSGLYSLPPSRHHHHHPCSRCSRNAVFRVSLRSRDLTLVVNKLSLVLDDIHIYIYRMMNGSIRCSVQTLKTLHFFSFHIQLLIVYNNLNK